MIRQYSKHYQRSDSDKRMISSVSEYIATQYKTTSLEQQTLLSDNAYMVEIEFAWTEHMDIRFPNPWPVYWHVT
ncbi:hypothetical protein K493DRAFT_17913 [Basidiobolus meristosporus CBS 931.73]|uniref:Uncharacterized protein n=1 Tax=Basidiobolus meristosporus CBS 931.73 TaxID=1314790 RepID=A0A1Y1YFA5_9FUNG|nr:hypothetical protein K493DRAFT_17913 [Basidiobolus meristosporus CBS 931.73]|eukprot:ORX96655.1 hypothetical protein K493DRAFT_17913 [Basidiobolus meristosporus CBS 931.73]